jgi:hypothetical protein
MRDNYRLPEYNQDLIGNKLAMEYAKYLLKGKDSDTAFNAMYINK